MVGPAAVVGGQDRDGASYRRSALYTLCLFEAFPSRGNEGSEEKKQRVIYFTYHFGVFPPLVAGATTFPPRSSVGRQKESALMGRLGALLRPT